MDEPKTILMIEVGVVSVDAATTTCCVQVKLSANMPDHVRAELVGCLHNVAEAIRTGRVPEGAIEVDGKPNVAGQSRTQH